jgi:hypothetical protein
MATQHDAQQFHVSGEEPDRPTELTHGLPGLHQLPPEALARALELHALELRQAEREQLETGTRTDRPAGTQTRWCPDCSTIQPLDQFRTGYGGQRVGRCSECLKIVDQIRSAEARNAEELLARTLEAREKVTTHAGLAAAAQTMLALTADAGGPAGLARWLRYRVDRAEACGDFRTVVRLMAILAAIAGLQATITPREMAGRIADIRGFDKEQRSRAKKRTKKARQHAQGTPPGEASEPSGQAGLKP